MSGCKKDTPQVLVYGTCVLLEITESITVVVASERPQNSRHQISSIRLISGNMVPKVMGKTRKVSRKPYLLHIHLMVSPVA